MSEFDKLCRDGGRDDRQRSSDETGHVGGQESASLPSAAGAEAAPVARSDEHGDHADAIRGEPVDVHAGEGRQDVSRPVLDHRGGAEAEVVASPDLAASRTYLASPHSLDARPVWHIISSGDLLALLRRVAAGEDPELVYLEAYANADHEACDG